MSRYTYFTLLCSFVFLTAAGRSFAQTDGVWRVLQRNGCYEGWDYNGGDWTPVDSYSRETPYYHNTHTDVIDSICAEHRIVSAGNDTGWYHYNTIHYNPSVMLTTQGKSVSYEIYTDQGYNLLSWNGHYDTQNRLVEYSSTRIYSLANQVTTHEIYYYNSRNEPDSIYKYTFNNLGFGQHQKTINVYDSLGRKTTELIYTSANPPDMQLTKRVLLHYRPDMYPAGYYFKTQNPMFLQRQGYVPGSCLNNNFSGLTTPYMADSLCIQVWQDSIWVDQEYDYYSVNYYTPGTPQINIEQWETQYIPPPPDYQPPRYCLLFDPNGLFTGESYSIDDGFSPPSYSGVSYTWEYYVPNEDNVTPPVAGMSLGQNYPNPFSQSTAIRFDNRKNSVLSLKIYNTRGQLVKTLCDRVSFKTGDHIVSWDGRNDTGQELASGVYFYKLSDGDETQVRKMLLFK